MKLNELKDMNARRILAAFLRGEQATSSQEYSTDNLVLVPLIQGRSGAGIYKFILAKSDYVLRMFSPLENKDDRKREAHISRVAGENNTAGIVCAIVDNLNLNILLSCMSDSNLLKSDI